jgi:DinB family protein
MEERIVAADPVLDPQGYQRELLALLGTNDPLEVMAKTPGTFAQRAAALPGEAVARRPAPREWSVAELLGHLWDAEIAYSFRARAILAQDQPRLIG